MTSSSIGTNNYKGTIKPNEAMASRLEAKPETILCTINLAIVLYG